MPAFRSRLRTLVLVVVAAALVLAAEASTRDLEVRDRRVVLVLSGLLALVAVPLLASRLPPSGRLRGASRREGNPQAELLLELCGDRGRRPPRKPPVPEHLGFLVVWARALLLLGLAIPALCALMVELVSDAPGGEAAEEVAWELSLIASGACLLSAIALMGLWTYKYERFLSFIRAMTPPKPAPEGRTARPAEEGGGRPRGD
jgi:hypothetical protein